MNGTNSQGTYTKFFETFTQRGWCIANQNIFSLKDKNIFGSELLLRVGNEGDYLDNSKYFPNICERKEFENISIEILKLVKKNLFNSPNSFKEKTFMNFSPSEIKNDFIFQSIKELGQLFKSCNKQLVIELSEIFSISDFELLTHKIHSLTDDGIDLAIDDYGKGILDSKVFNNFKISFLKLDKSICSDAFNQNLDLANKILKYCFEKNIICIAEGIETQEMLTSMNNLGVNLGQGYYFHKPEIIFSN